MHLPSLYWNYFRIIWSILFFHLCNSSFQKHLCTFIVRDRHFKKELKFKWGKDDKKKLLPLPYRDGTDM